MKITLNKVKECSKREDKILNDRNHWFSSIFSTYLTYIFLKLKLSANQVTLLFLATGIFSIIFYYQDTIWTLIIAYTLFRLHIIIDMCDGEVARFNNKFSENGKYWDSLIHSTLNPLFYFFSTYPLLDLNSHSKLLSLTFLTFSVSFLLFSKYNFQGKILKNKNEVAKRSLKGWLFFIISELISIEGYILCISILRVFEFQNFILMTLIISFTCINFISGFIKIVMISKRKIFPYK